MRGDIHRLKSSRDATGHEQQGRRYAVELQSSLVRLSTVLVAPTSTRAHRALFRPETVMESGGRETAPLVMVDQMCCVDSSRLGECAGRLESHEMDAVEQAMRIVLGLL